MKLTALITKALTATSILACAVTAVFAGEPRISFPTDYRSTMVNYLSLDRTQNPDQVMRLFAPKEAIEAVNRGEEIPYGTVLVAEVYKAKKDAEGNVIETSLGRRVRDKFAAVAVMEKQKGWGDIFSEDLKNGDWDFAIFKPTGERLVKKNLDGCRSCHAPLKDTQHMFSYEHLSLAN